MSEDVSVTSGDNTHAFVPVGHDFDDEPVHFWLGTPMVLYGLHDDVLAGRPLGEPEGSGTHWFKIMRIGCPVGPFIQMTRQHVGKDEVAQENQEARIGRM